MAAITTIQATAAIDNIGQTVVDALAGLPTTSQQTTVNTDLGTQVTRILAYTDSVIESIMSSAWVAEQRNSVLQALPNGPLVTFLATTNYAKLLQNAPYIACDALDFACGQTSGYTGLASLLSLTGTLVDLYSADVFNSFVSAVTSGAYIRKYGTNIPAKIATTSVFVHGNVDTLNLFTTNSTTTGLLTAGSATLVLLTGGNTIPSGGVLEAYAGNTIGGAASTYVITVTYTNFGGTAGQVGTFTVTKGATINTVFAPGGTYYVASIQSVAITTGTANGSGDIINFRLKPARTITA